eukprot:11155745-Lingulodinium_polyedra.AAC.1
MRWRNFISVRTGRARGATSLAFGQKSATKDRENKPAKQVRARSSANKVCETSFANKVCENKFR